MNKSSAAVGLFIGCFLIYVSLFGVSGFVFQLTGTENYTIYTETDPNNHVTVEMNRISFDRVTRSEATYVYSSKAVQSDFTHYLEVQLTDCDLRYARVFVWSLATSVGTFEDCRSASIISVSLYQRTLGTYYLEILEGYNGELYGSEASHVIIQKNQPYYLTISKSGLTLTLNVYTDASRTVSVGTATLTVQGNQAYSYVYALQSLGPTLANPSAWVTGYVAYLSLGGAPSPSPDGYGTVTLSAWDGTNYITGASLTITFPDGHTETVSTPYSNPSASIGSYTVQCSYSGQNADTHSFTLADGGTESFTFNFGSTPPPNGDDFLDRILQFIEGILQNQSLKSLMLMVGIGLVGICGIVLIMPGRKYSPPPRYY